jgi:hypothetical protein
LFFPYCILLLDVLSILAPFLLLSSILFPSYCILQICCSFHTCTFLIVLFLLVFQLLFSLYLFPLHFTYISLLFPSKLFPPHHFHNHKPCYIPPCLSEPHQQPTAKLSNPHTCQQPHATENQHQWLLYLRRRSQPERPKAEQKFLVLARQAQQTNQGRTPFFCTPIIPICLSFKRQQGSPLSSLSAFNPSSKPLASSSSGVTVEYLSSFNYDPVTSALGLHMTLMKVSPMPPRVRVNLPPGELVLYTWQIRSYLFY